MTVGRATPPSAKSTQGLYKSLHSTKQQAMLATHQRLPIHMEYLQPHITTTESKASPLALLAATCSSIGKTDAEKNDLKTTTTSPIILSKLSPSQEAKKSSFKPYKVDDREKNTSPQPRSPPKSIIRNSPPLLVSNTNIVSSKVGSSYSNPDSRSSSNGLMREKMTTVSSSSKPLDEYAKYQERIAKDIKESYHSSMKCRTNISPPLPHLPSKVSMLPHSHSHHGHADCGQYKTGRPHSEIPRPRSSSCSCPMCSSGNNNRNDSNCHYPPHPSGVPGMYHPAHKPPTSLPPPQPVMACRDPNCNNCTKIHNGKGLQNYVHPALAHQCANNSPPLKSSYGPPPQNVPSSYDPYFHKKGAMIPKSKPHVCNWVSDGKHCGGSFVTSEELYQHLRTHTNLQQQRTNERMDNLSPTHPISVSTQPPQGGCNIHGCPCGGAQRNTSPRTHGIPAGYGPNSRYSPYARPVPAGGHGMNGHTFPPPPHSVYYY